MAPEAMYDFSLGGFTFHHGLIISALNTAGQSAFTHTVLTIHKHTLVCAYIMLQSLNMQIRLTQAGLNVNT